MQTYTMNQWLMFFYFYCFLGWVWESCYVSAKEHKWVNRGFLHGPLLPIYGSGAIVVLIATIPVIDSIPLIFVFGLIAATLLEYFTGVAMERLFHVRYWDYSNQPCNFKGHICLVSSIGWGLFSILMEKVIHPPIETLLLDIPETISQIAVYLVTIVITVDFVQSFHEAMDLKELLTKLTENNEDIARIQKRLEVSAAFWDESKNEWMEQASEKKDQFSEKLSDALQTLQEYKDASLQKLPATPSNPLAGKNPFSRNLEKERAYKRLTFDSFEKYINKSLDLLESLPDSSKEKAREMKDELFELKDKVKALTIPTLERNDKKYSSSLHLLHRNPGSKSKEYAQALDHILALEKKENDLD